MDDLVLILAGALLCNSIPHLASGLQGAAFPTPFAKPRGVGNSSAPVNFFWGSFNLLVGVALLWRVGPAGMSATGLIALAIGFVASGSYLSRHFGRVRRGAAPGPT